MADDAQGQALALVTEKTNLVNQYAPQVIGSLATFYDGLTEEQQAKVRSHIAETRFDLYKKLAAKGGKA